MMLHRYKKAEERSSLNDAMVHLLPLIHQICTQLLGDQSELSVTIQKQILKIFFALIQVIKACTHHSNCCCNAVVYFLRTT